MERCSAKIRSSFTIKSNKSFTYSIEKRNGNDWRSVLDLNFLRQLSNDGLGSLVRRCACTLWNVKNEDGHERGVCARPQCRYRCVN